MVSWAGEGGGTGAAVGSSRSSPRARWGFTSASWSRTTLRRSGSAVLRRDEARAVLTWKLGHFLRAPLCLAVTRPRVLASVDEGFWTNFLRFST